jgi:hypothetical protein
MFADMLSKDQKAAIADVAIAHAELEAELDRCIIDLCKVYWPHGAILLDAVRVERKLDMLIKLLEVEFRGKDVPPLLLTVCADLKSLNSQRNVVIHGQWTLRSLANYDVNKPPKPGSGRREIQAKDIVVQGKKRGKQAATIGAKAVRKTADLIALNRRLLHQLFYENFADRITGLAGLAEKPDTTALALSKLVTARATRKN